jgi:hypothetical protein
MTRVPHLRSSMIAILIVAGLAASMATSTSALAGSPCADLSASASPGIVPPGDPETLSGSITNCSQQTEMVTVGIKLTGPCGFAFHRRFNLTLYPGQTLDRSVTFPAPDCEGLYTVKARALSEGEVLDQAEAAFKVCQNCQGA